MSGKCNWRLDAISNAAKTRKKISFVLKAGENKVGKKKDCLLKIPSVLCSREHCTIFLDGDKVTIEDKSRNGTYITFSGEIGTKQYLNEKTENALEPNDIISFGFNTASVYDVHDKNAFIYRLVKEDIETIDLDDLDDSDEEMPAPSKGKIIDIDDKVIDIPSDSDSEYSGSECLQNIEDVKDAESSSSVEMSDDFEESSSNESIESDESDDYGNFVVTNTILKCGTPTETIALDEDSSASEREAEAQPSNDDQTSVQSEPDKDKEKDKKTESNGMVIEEPSTSEASKSNDTPSTTNDNAVSSVNDKKPSENQAEEAKVESTTQISDETRLANLKRRLAENQPKRTAITKPQPLKKRRQTLTESEYNERKVERKRTAEEQKRIRKERLAQIGIQQKEARDAAAEEAGEPIRVLQMPKVKISSTSRAENLCTDMLADNFNNT